MEIGIVGGSASGLYSAILIKRRAPSARVVVFEKNDRVGKKLSATGNGHCNILNKRVSGQFFHGSKLAFDLFRKYPYQELSRILEDIGVCLLEQGDLVYPMCYHAPTYTKFLFDTAISLGVEFVLSTKVISYNKEGKGYSLLTEDNSYFFDRVVFAVGGKSQKKFGSDGAFFDLFASKGYSITQLSPSLCPIKVKENVKPLSGLRHRASVSAFVDGKLVYVETGEVLFKEDGLSGIAIMNASSYFAKTKEKQKKEIVLDLFPSVPVSEVSRRILKSVEVNPKYGLSTWMEKPIKDYIFEYCGVFGKKTLNHDDVLAISNAAKYLRFTYVSQYGFDYSQVSSGGVKISEINVRFESKKEKGVYFIGEMVDVDGLCGGFNLSFALASALEVANSIL